MSTRAVLIFKASEYADVEFAIYQHGDGDPASVSQFIDLARYRAWELPRFEADEFAAAYIAATKRREGMIRLLPNPSVIGDATFTYVIHSAVNRQGGRYIYVVVYDGPREDGIVLYRGATGGLREWANRNY